MREKANPDYIFTLGSKEKTLYDLVLDNGEKNLAFILKKHGALSLQDLKAKRKKQKVKKRIPPKLKPPQVKEHFQFFIKVKDFEPCLKLLDAIELAQTPQEKLLLSQKLDEVFSAQAEIECQFFKEEEIDGHKVTKTALINCGNISNFL